jgi:ankyrin repeat protein
MFPNPQDALPLPPRPNIEQYKKLAKDLVKVCETGKPEALRDWASEWVRNVARLSGLEVTPDLPVEIQKWVDDVVEFATLTLLSGERKCVLTGAQFVIARSHGFMSWPKLVKHIGEVVRGRSSVAQFETAAEAIISGDVAALNRLLRETPGLIRQRSTREHGATLLHYTSANGIEGYRQKTPKNIVEIAELLLQSGAEVDAEAHVYGGGCTTLGLAATSVHPEAAGVQEALLQLLLDHGASIERPNLAGNRHSAVIACFANGQPRAGEFLAARSAWLDLESAAGVGRLEVVKTFFTPEGTLKPPATKRQLQNGFLWACMYGRRDVVVFLLEHGAELLDRADTGGTALHWAAGGGHLGIVQLLLERGAPLEEINAWGGTVLEGAGWGFEHSAPGIDFAPVFEMLLAAGAVIRGRWLEWIEKLKSRSADERTRVAEVFRRYGATI